jgi:hypothetical protein
VVELVIGNDDDDEPTEAEVTIQRGIAALEKVIAAFKELFDIVGQEVKPIRAQL